MRAPLLLLVALLAVPAAAASDELVDVTYSPSADFATLEVQVRHKLDGAQLAEAFARVDRDGDGNVTPAEVAARWNASLTKTELDANTTPLRMDAKPPRRAEQREDASALLGARNASAVERWVVTYALDADDGAAGHVLTANLSASNLPRVFVVAPEGWSLGSAVRTDGERTVGEAPARNGMALFEGPDLRGFRVTFVNDSLVDAAPPATPAPPPPPPSAPASTTPVAKRAPGAEAWSLLAAVGLLAWARRRAP